MINQILGELDQLQKKEFIEEWKEVGRQLIIEDLQIKLIQAIREELVKNCISFNLVKSYDVRLLVRINLYRR